MQVQNDSPTIATRLLLRGVDPAQILGYPVETTALILSVSTPTIWRMLRAGKLEAVKVAARTIVTKESITRYLAASRATFRPLATNLKAA